MPSFESFTFALQTAIAVSPHCGAMAQALPHARSLPLFWIVIVHLFVIVMNVDASQSSCPVTREWFEQAFSQLGEFGPEDENKIPIPAFASVGPECISCFFVYSPPYSDCVSLCHESCYGSVEPEFAATPDYDNYDIDGCQCVSRGVLQSMVTEGQYAHCRFSARLYTEEETSDNKAVHGF